jgi:hypothetical protein
LPGELLTAENDGELDINALGTTGSGKEYCRPGAWWKGWHWGHNGGPFDNALKEDVIRARLHHLGFDREKEGFEYIVRDRREHLVPALQPTRCQDLDSVIDLFNIQL